MRSLIAAVGLVASFGVAQADSATFNSVPANIADAPVKTWRNVQRADTEIGVNGFGWKAHFDSGGIWIWMAAPGSYWPEAPFTSESGVLKKFKEWGFSNFGRVESTAYAGSQWGYMAVADWRGKSCVVGVVLDDDNLSHDGGQGGSIQGFAFDCGAGAAGRFDDWHTWFRSFKRVPLGYNALLDR